LFSWILYPPSLFSILFAIIDFMLINLIVFYLFISVLSAIWISCS